MGKFFNALAKAGYSEGLEHENTAGESCERSPAQAVKQSANISLSATTAGVAELYDNGGWDPELHSAIVQHKIKDVGRKQTGRHPVRNEVDRSVDVNATKNSLKKRVKNIRRGAALLYLKKKLKREDHSRDGREITDNENDILTNGKVISIFSAKSADNNEFSGTGAKFAEISEVNLMHFTGNSGIEWPEESQGATAYHQGKSYLKPVAYSLGIFFLISVTWYSLKLRNGDQLGREQSAGANESVVLLDKQPTIAKSVKSDIVKIEKPAPEVKEQPLSVQKQPEFIVKIGELQIQDKYLTEERVLLNNSNEISDDFPVEKIVPESHKITNFVYYIVASGDNLYRISLKYKIQVNEIRELNGISENNLIYPGQKLKVGWK